MKYTRIPNTDVEVSVLCLGTWVFGRNMWGGSNEQESLGAVEAALDQGINFIDTAPIYGDGVAERIVGKAIKGKRDKFVLATKCGLVREGDEIRVDLSPKAIRRDVEDSLKRLGTDRIDLYQCHWPDPQRSLERTVEALLGIRAEGKIRHIGVSNFGLKVLKKALDLTGIVSLQSQYSLLERSIEREILPYCQSRQVGFLAYGALGGGILSGKYHSPRRFDQGDARGFLYKYYEGAGYERAQRLNATLECIGRPLHEVAINGIRQQEGVTSVIVGCRNADQAKANAASAAWDLTEEELRKIVSCEFESA